MPWLEVETKIKIDNINNIKNKIKKIAKFIKKEKKIDEYFSLKRKSYPGKAFRIRIAGSGYVMNFKRWLKQYYSKDIVVKEEFEINLKNKENLNNVLELFKDLGFRKWVKKIKLCEIYKYGNVFIEINKVKHLGNFLEIEYLCQKKDINKAKKKIREVLKKLDVKQKDVDNTGYTKMLWNKGIRG